MTAQLLSVNVGRPREVQWEGKTVRSAIWKEPVEGPRMVRRINIDGDDQADRLAHGGEHRAVYVYQMDSYRYWERELGRDDFTYGQFGENFTVEGLADDEVCIGDRYRDRRSAGRGDPAARDVLPRSASAWTCRRCPRCSSPTTGPGFYLRVLEEGEVQAGDEIVKVADGPEQLTIAQVDALLYLPNKSRAAARAGAARAGAERGLEGQLPRAARQGRRRRAAPGVDGLPRRCASRRSGARARRSPRSGSCRPTVSPSRGRGPASTSRCACGRTPTRRRSSAATRCRTCPARRASGSASSARARAAALCTTT